MERTAASRSIDARMNGNLADAVSFVREDVQKMKAYAPGEQITGCIKLNTNECAWGPAPAVLKAVCAVTEDQLRLYPSPMSDKVRKAASEVFGVQPAQVLVGNGSDDCLTIIMRTFSQPGDTVACAWPTYSLYDTLASIQGVGIQHVDWLAQPDPVLGQADGVPGWHLPITGLLQTGARVVFIANPNNPSATRVPLPALEYLASHLKGILVVDEAYIDYALDGDGMAASFLGKLDAYPNVLVLRTFSKSYSMAGARLGLMFAHAELIDHMNKVKDSYNVNALTQLAGEAALLDRAYFSWLVGETIKQRKVSARRSSRLALWPASAFSPSTSPWLISCPFSPSLAPTSSPAPIPSPPPSPGLRPRQPPRPSPPHQALEAACKGFGWTWPTSDANFVLMDVGSAAKAGALYEKCREGGVLVRYWGSRPELASKLRVTVGTKESVDKFVAIVTQALPSLECM